ncbi:Rho GTPase activating protein 25 [Pitangus sulphuratus]|nr:Rho GTPase activating protein 25 [Pitangus sulphuratus]
MSGDPAGARPGSPSALERPLKLGWLKKQRSIVKNWQHRYFVLKGQQLYYYKDEDDAKPQGCLSLQGSTIKEVASNPEEGGKFIFEIIPGGAGEQPRAGQDPCVLMASSQCEMEEWVKSIRRALGSAAGAVFGQRLAETMAYEQKFGQPQVPILVQKCAEFIREHGLSEEGIFRLPGQDNLVKQLRDAFDAGERPSFDRFLHEIQLNSSVNKMSVDNLATVIGVNLIRPKIEDPATIMRGTPRVQKVMTVMISDHESLFPLSKDVPLSPPAPKNDKKAPVPRSSVGWGAAEDPAVPRAVIQRRMRDDPNSSGAPGPAASSSTPREDKEPKDTLGTWKMEPRKRTQTLPNRKSLLAAAAPGDKGSQEKRDVFASDFWKSSPGSSSRPVLPDGHKRTLSHDLFKLLDLHRAATCDNVPPSPPESGDGSGSSPSPCSSISDREFLPCPSPSHEPRETASPATEVPKPDQESGEFLQNMVLRLEREMEAQKNDYEEQIKSLQKENYEVWAKVVRLNQDIEREKKKSEELQLKLMNVERSREDVEKKNKKLEEELKKLSKPTGKTGDKTN